MDLLTHPKWQQFLIQRSQVITWILNHHPDLFQSPAKAGGFCKAILHTHTETHTDTHTDRQTPHYLQRFLFHLSPDFSVWKQSDFPLVLGYSLLPFTSSQPWVATQGKAQDRGGQCRDAWSLCKAPPEHPERVTQSSAAPGVQAIPSVESAAGCSSKTCHAPRPEHCLQQGFKVSKLSPLTCRCGKAPPVLTP